MAGEAKIKVASASVNTEKKHSGLIPYVAGQSGNPKGRPKGSRNKLGEDFVLALQESFNQHGAATIETVRSERPHEYLKVVASILPKEVNVNTRIVEELSDDDIIGAITALRSISAAKDVGSGTEEKTRH